MRKDFAMSLGGFAAMVLDYIVVASFVGLLLLARWIGFGLTFDILTILLVSYGILAWLCGRRLNNFFVRQTGKNSHSGAGEGRGRRTLIKSTRFHGLDSR
jgi:hypothetical protein